MGRNHKATTTQRNAALAVFICGVSLCLCDFVVPVLAQNAAVRIKTAQYALGMIRGPRRIDAINTMEFWGTRTRDGVTYHVSLSYLTPAMRVDVTRSNPAGRQIEVVNGNFAWNESVPGAGFIPGTTAIPMPGAVKDRLLQLWSTPHGALKAAEQAASNAKVTTENGASVITFPLAAPLAGITMKITLNAKDQVEKVETRTDNGAVTEITYSDYQDLGEIKSDVLFPSHMIQKRTGFPVQDVTITKADANNPYVVFPVPENVEKGQHE
jgi:hypothetical protein